jgi:phosphatidylserine/phosphatidylglycerophosphate/cardiolipin synthase-like enzyme
LSAVAVAVCAIVVAPPTWTTTNEPSRLEACFTPRQNCTKFIIQQIARARSELLVQAYLFTSKPIIEAVCKAKSRQVTVKVLLDRTNELERYATTTARLNGCADVLVDDGVKIAHNKVLIIDRMDVITGSFNLTNAAIRNAENVFLVPDHPRIAEMFAGNFEERARGARPLR